MGTGTQSYQLIVSSIFGDEVDLLVNEEDYHEHWINSLQFSNDNRSIYTSSEDHSVLIYDFENQKKSNRIIFESIPISLKTNRDSIVDICSGDYLFLLDNRTDAKKKIKFQNELITSERLGDQSIIMTSDKKGNLFWTDLRKEKILFELKNESYITSLEYKNGLMLLNTTHTPILLSNVDYFNGNVDNLKSYKNQKIFKGTTNQFNLKNASFSNDLNYIVSGSDNGEIFIWNTNDASISQKIEIPSMLESFNRSSDILTYSPTIGVFSSYFLENSMIGVSYTCGTFIYSLKEYPMIPLTMEDEEFTEFEPWEMNENELDHGICSCEKGYIDQIVFICLTCFYEKNIIAGICSQCEKYCHVNHEKYNIGKKSKFKCDCGTKKYQSVQIECEINDQNRNEEENEMNKYNQNFKNEWCYCSQKEERPMYQCEECEDWFHGKCIGTIDANENFDFICEICLKEKYDFLKKYPDLKSNSNFDSKYPILGEIVTRGRFLPFEWKDSILVEDKSEEMKIEENNQMKDAVQEIIEMSFGDRIVRNEILEKFVKSVKQLIDEKLINSRRNIISSKDIEEAIQEISRNTDLSIFGQYEGEELSDEEIGE
eukprot:gene1080-10599_t